MAITRYGTSVTLCEDTRQTFELYDLLKQADPNYSAVEPARITLYVFNGSTWVTVSAPGFFSAVDKDTFEVDMSYLPNFNGIQQVRVLGSDSSGNSFILNLTINVTPVNDAPTGEDETVALANGDSYVLGLADFGFNDPVEGDAFKSVVFTTVPAHGTLLLDGVAVTAGQEILASDIEAGKLSYTAPVDAGGPIGFDFQVRDTGGTDGCGGNDLDLTPNTITFNVPYPATAIIGDRVWEDTNGNGVQDAGETGLAGVTVLLKDIGGNTVATTATDANGNYSFTVNAGTYSVAVVAPAGYKVTEADMGPSDATDSDIDDAGNSPLVTVAAGDNNTTIDAGLFRTAEIGDRVWLDTNGNGQQDTGEAGVAGVIVRLYNAAGDLVDGPLATDANGNYLFTNLRPGTYSVQFDKTTLPAGYSFTTADSGSDVTDSDANSLDGKTIQTVLDSGESDRTWDAGIVANPGAITGTVLEDLDHNGTGDTPIAGVTVVLKDASGAPIATTTTDANGNYSFANVPAGNYTVEQTNKPGFTDVSDIDGGNPNSIAVTVTPGATNPGNNFIDERLPGNISGTVREDLDNNNTGDTPIAGVTVVLKDASGTPIATTTTDANGNYSFANVPAGTYTVEQTNKPGYTDVSDIDGGNPNSIAVSLQPGQSSTGNDFVDERLPGAITGTVLEDLDHNGTGDTPIAGVTVVLKDASGAPIATTTTDANGNYSFANVPAGNYTVEQTNKPGYTDVSDIDGGNPNSIAVSLQPGQSSTGNDFVDERLPGAITGTVLEDLDNNGTGDTPIAGVTVVLKDASGAPIATTTTDANGNYSFANVPAGNYTVEQTNKPGYTDVSDIDGGNPNSIAVSLQPGQSSTGNDFVNERPATLGDRVWLDTNANGVQDAGEAGLAGVTVQLKNADGSVAQTATTDANGNYSFTVSAGTYSVAVQTPGGYVVTGQDLGGNEALDSDINAAGQSAQVTLTSGQNNPNVNAGLYKLAELGDRVWFDANGNGQQDMGEAGVQGVKVTLLDASGNPVGASLTTDANGNYLFTGLKPGTYSVQFDKTTLPAGYSFTTANSGSDVTDSDANSLDGKTIQTVLDSGESDRTWDAGIVANPGAITGTVLEDLDNNGTGDTPIAGVTVVLKDASGAPIATTTTDANGNYSFANVPAGNYTVEQTNKPGYTDVSDIDGGNPNSIAVTVTPGATNSGNTFIDERTAAIGDKVWLDKNANGVQDAGEAGLAGVTVKLLDSAGNVVTTATTDANGNYLFGNLVPGNYAVQVVAPAGYTVTGKDLGGNDALDSDIDPTTGKTITTTLSAGETDLSWDAGLYQKASIGDRVWLDANKNGVQDTGEAGIAGVTVKLINAAGGVAATATTDANGNYLFSNLTPGSYSVQVVAPAGYSITGKDLGGNDALDSDIDPATGSTIATTLESGENDLSWDAGLYQQTASYGDKVWLDKNANGVQDAGETGLAGITVKLLNSTGGVVASTTTDANGNYLFNNLTPGDYAAQVVAPAGYFVSPKDQGGNDATDSDFDPTTGKTINTTLVANENDLSWDAGLYQKASIGDKVWADCNNNGLQDGTEAGVPGVVVKLLDASGNVVATTLTDGSGNYVFKDLMPGTYSVQVVAPAGYTFTSQDQGTNDAIDSDVGAGGVSGTNLIVNGSFESGTTGWTGYGDSIEVGTAGAYGVSAVTGAMVAELDANCVGSNTGFYQNVATVAGQTYQLSVDLAQRAGYAASTNTVEVWWEGAKIATIDPTSTALTKYSFTVTAADASSRVEFREQAGDDDSVGGIIDNVSLVSTASSSAGKTAQTVLESGENDMSWDAGLTVQKVTATFDFSGNTATDGTDGNIYCYSNNGISVNASAWSRDKTYGSWSKAFLGAYGGGLGVTDSSEGSGSGDSHTVDNVGRDNYVLFEFSQTVVVDKTYLGYVVGDSDVKVWIGTVNGAFDSHIALTDAVLSSMGFTEVNATTLTSARWADLNANGFAGNVLVIAANTTGGDCNDNFKIEQLVVSTASAFCATDVSIGDKVWNDANMNGVQDAGEAGIAGVAVKLLNSAGAVITTTTTDANGNYLFSQLAAGDYKIQVVTPNGYVITGKDLGGNDALDSDIDSSGTTGVYTLTQGSNNLSVDAGLYCPPVTASIGDKVWEDMNYNGLQDAGEAGIKGVTVKLLNSAGTVVATATTDANGNYLFSNLAPGDYKVQVVAPTGYYITKQNQGTNDAVDSDIDATGKTALVTLSAGENERSVDGGLYRKASIGDKVWEDVNHNNLQDSGEAGIANVKVWLWSATTQSWTSTYTDAYGNYKFTNLNPGSYQLCFDKSATVYKGIDMSNWFWGTKDVGTDNSRDADAYSTTDQAYTAFTTLVSGEADMTWDAAITPIVLDLDRNGIQTIAREDSTGKFDLFGNGKAIDSGWISSGDAFLAIDIDHNGKIDNLSELFGGTSKGDGFAKLGAFDSNGDGFVDASDAHFADLRVWQDLNGNHQTDAGELRTLAEAGVASLKVDHIDLPAVDAQGNLHLERSSAVMADGSSIDMADVYFNVSLADANEAGVELPNLASLLGDDRSLDLVLGASVSVGEAAVTTASAVGNDSAVAALGQLSSLYEEQQYALMAA